MRRTAGLKPALASVSHVLTVPPPALVSSVSAGAVPVAELTSQRTSRHAAEPFQVTEPAEISSDDAPRRNVFKGRLVCGAARVRRFADRLPEGAEGGDAARPRHGEGDEAR